MGWSVNRATGLTWNRPDSTTKGYTLVTPSSDQATYLLDMDGRVHYGTPWGRVRLNVK